MELTKEQIKEMLSDFQECVKYGNTSVWVDPTDKQYIRVVVHGAYYNLVDVILEDYSRLMPFINARWKFLDGAAYCNRMKAPIKDGAKLVYQDIEEWVNEKK